MVRFKNQQGTVKDTQFEVKETKDATHSEADLSKLLYAQNPDKHLL